jgi:hypothetical protein
MKIVKKRMTEPGVFGLRKHQFGSHYFKKWDTALFANENFATYTTTLHIQPCFGTGFYNHVFELLSKESNITF